MESKNYKNHPHEFLHNHPGSEKRLGLDENHVIVDRADWEAARKCKKGVIVVIDGIRSGKSVLAQVLANRLNLAGSDIEAEYVEELLDSRDELKTMKDIELVCQRLEEPPIIREPKTYKNKYAQRYARKSRW